MMINDAGLRFRSPPVRRTRTAEVVLHHLHSRTGTVHDVHRWHLDAGKIGNGYNFIIYLNGEIWAGRGMYAVGAHTVNHNSVSVGVGFQGRYDDQDRVMPDVQFNAGVWLLKYLWQKFSNVRISGHGELRPTACPGRFFPLAEMKTLKYRGNLDTGGLTMTQFEKLLEKITDIQIAVDEVRRTVMPYFSSTAEMPEWAQDAHVDAVRRGIINGAIHTSNDIEIASFNTPVSRLEMRQTVMAYRREQG